ncbi:hypothetical protein MCHI_003443 [Candidatus Magnetoovum chiemensis]|nr:hypothetical protein MCHI_003443 [Candidatus Magnetoovum chiemensis]
MDNELITVKIAAKALETTERSIHRYIVKGLLTKVKQGGRTYVKADDVRKLRQEAKNKLETVKACHNDKETKTRKDSTSTVCIKIDRYDDMMKRIGELEERNKLLLEYKATKEYDIRQRDHAIEKLKERIAEFEQDLEHARQSFLSRILSKFR